MKPLSMPFQVGWDVTHQCNFRCKHCLFTAKQLSEKRSPSKQEALEFVRHLGAEGVFHLSMAGGEPLIYPHIVDVVSEATRLGMSVSMSTNATLLTPDLAADMKSAGLRSFQISLDGHTPEINDRIRGTGTFARTMRGIKEAQDANISVFLAVVILPHNYDFFEEYLDFAKNIGAVGIKIQTLIDSGLASVNFEHLSMDEDHTRCKLLELWNLKEKYSDSLEILLPVIPEVLDRLDKQSEKYYKSNACLGCQPGRLTVRVNAAGDVRACGGIIDARVIGNVFKTPLKQIWKEHQSEISINNERAVANGLDATSCGAICGKGCRSTNSKSMIRQDVSTEA